MVNCVVLGRRMTASHLHLKRTAPRQSWWSIAVIQAPRRQRQEDLEPRQSEGEPISKTK
jgi:hypothetical protein